MVDQPLRPAVSDEKFPLDSLLEQMRAEAKAESVETLNDAQIETLCTELWEWSKTLGDGTSGIRIRQYGDGHLLEVVGPDRPFLVDSLLSACTLQGFDVRTLFHPLLNQSGGKRLSLIQIHLPLLTDTEVQRLEAEARETLDDVALATNDYHAMRARMSREVERLIASPHVSDHYKNEAAAFLNWLGNEHFVFLGTRDYTFPTGADGNVLPEEPDMVEGSNLGLLRDEDRNVLNRGAEPLVLNREIGEFLSEPEPLILAKATLQSRVHRRVACDYVGVKHFGENGQVVGETRFLGLYTAEAYNRSVKEIPLVRRRVERVIEASGALKGTHNEKALSNIMESWPRDELFQTKSERLTPIMLGVLQLIGRPRVRVFLRPDRFNRFVSAIVFVPREAYDTALREKISQRLEAAFNGKLTSFSPSFDGAALVRVMFEIMLPDDAPEVDAKSLETDIAALSRTWNERFRSAIMSSPKDGDAKAQATIFTGAFSAGYREAFTPEEAMIDVETLADLSADKPIILRAFRMGGDSASKIRAKIYSRNGAISLSDCVPVFERMGLFVSFETGYPVTPRGKPAADAPETYWIHDLSMRRNDGGDVDLDKISAAFQDAFVVIWSGKAENDGFNALIFNAELTWHEAALCRALCAYRHQTGMDPTPPTQIEALNANPVLTRKLVALFKAQFDPENQADDAACKDLKSDIETALNDVKSLDHDRIIRRLAALIGAIQRTNYFQHDRSGNPRPFVSFKIASRELSDLPSPKPYREIFMSSPLVEGVHCRFGAVARGGLRWSDRRDDFRTEVLGLVKAQQVKNAVIVPVGSKGGFFPKQLPQNGSREEVRDAGIEAYRTFITSLLDLTDNLIDGEVQHPENTVIRDGEDPYLVVAADKGTATFSDIANEISQSQGFWLGDAFASGGSAGYDHKKMGITARGGWEAVKRHFREIGKDIQNEPFTVIGCGDMSGDVFGNGMLLSKQIRLQAAFNHMHIFIDPDPQDPEATWEERKRMFDLPRSSWTDYDQSLISEGGGIFERSAKSIELSPQMKELTGLKSDTATPDEILHALLKAECELLWFGGIGTYIKSSDESQADADDRSNDAIRVNGKHVRAKVIGEGANLGLTQAGRIEFAQHGGRLNTDAIDNSAGVDSSDHEVNIKILCTEAMRRGDLPSGERNTLLASMTDDVAAHVLAHNYAQTGALSIAEASAQSDHDANERLMQALEDRGVLDREVEGLPDTAEMTRRGEAGEPLTRPELAVLMAWTKIVLFDDLSASDVPDDPYFADTLQAYFPKALHTYKDPMHAHRLQREIIATVLSNRIIDVCGPVFLLRLREQTDASNDAIVSAFETVRNLFGAADLQKQIADLDNEVPASQQLALSQTLADALFEATQNVLQADLPKEIDHRLSHLRDDYTALTETIPNSLSSFETTRYNKAVKQHSKQDTPADLADAIVRANWLVRTPLINEISAQQDASTADVCTAFHTVGEGLSLDRLAHAAREALPSMPYWDRLATRRLIKDLETQQADATRKALNADGAEAWLSSHNDARKQLVSNIKTYTSTKPTFAQFALAADAVRNFMQKAT